jgi:hypothetical protein
LTWNQRGVIVRLVEFQFHRKSIKTLLSLVIIHAFSIWPHDFLVNLETVFLCFRFGSLLGFFDSVVVALVALNFSSFLKQSFPSAEANVL